MSVTISVASGRVSVVSPYNPSFPARAKRLGGRWDAASKAWTFDARDESRVRKVCRDIYGTDGSPTAVVTLRVNVSAIARGDDLWVAGRQVARRPSRDESVRLGDGVVLIKGGFEKHGGSRNSPELAPLDDTVVEVRDVAEPAARAAVEKHPEDVAIIDAGANRRPELEAEAASLRARLAELEAELALM